MVVKTNHGLPLVLCLDLVNPQRDLCKILRDGNFGYTVRVMVGIPVSGTLATWLRPADGSTSVMGEICVTRRLVSRIPSCRPRTPEGVWVFVVGNKVL